MKKRIWIILVVVALIGLIAWRLAANKRKLDEKKEIPTQVNMAIPVNTAPVIVGSGTDQLIRTGTLVPWREASITSNAAGPLTSVNFTLGSFVSQGGTIAQVDNRSLQLQLDAAQLQATKLNSDLKRYQALLAGEATTEVNVADIRFNLATAQNRIAQIRKQMADNAIKAPISGQVVYKSVEPGVYVNPGMALGKIVDISTLKADVLVGEADAYKLRNGQNVRVTTDVFPGRTFNGTVVFISQQGDAAHNYQVQVKLSNPGNALKAGTFVNVDFIQNSQKPGLQIPRTAVVESIETPYVYVIQNNRAVRRNIATGRDFGNNIEVVNGLAEGEQVVVNGQVNLRDSTEVKVVKAG